MTIVSVILFSSCKFVERKGKYFNVMFKYILIKTPERQQKDLAHIQKFEKTAFTIVFSIITKIKFRITQKHIKINPMIGI